MGATVGPDGATVGVNVGSAVVGDSVSVGDVVGVEVGCDDGKLLGCPVGLLLGCLVGCIDG